MSKRQTTYSAENAFRKLTMFIELNFVKNIIDTWNNTTKEEQFATNNSFSYQLTDYKSRHTFVN